MKQQKIITKFIIYLLVVVTIGFTIWLLGSNVSTKTILSQNGIWNLRGLDFTVDCARLSGNVEYVSEELLTPEEFDLSPNIQVGQIPSRIEYLTSRIRLIVPIDGFYEIAGFADDKGSRIFINGEWLCDTGLPTATKEGNIPAEQFLSFTAKSKNGIIEIVQQTSNFVFRTNSNHIGWTIGSLEIVNRWVTGFIYSYVINMGFYIALFLVHMLLLIMMPTYYANLWFGLLCLVWALRTGITSVRPLSVLLPNLGWVISFRLEYLTVLSAVVLIAIAYNKIFPNVFPKWIFIFIYSTQGFFAILYLLLDPLAMSQTMIAYEAVALFVILFGIICFAVRVRNPDFKQKIIFSSLFLIFIGLVVDSLFYNGISLPFIHNVVTESIIMVFSLFQMTAMFIGTMEEVSKAQTAEQKLVLENAALERVSRLKTDLMDKVSHEMRTPLAVMMGFAQLTAAELKDKGADDETTADLDAMAAEAKRLAQLVEEMRSASLSKFMESEKQTTQPKAIINQIARMYAPIIERKNTKLILQLEENLLPVSAMPGELTQILFNLLNNADKHTHNGEVIIHASKLEKNIDSDDENNSFIQFYIKDTGSGIDPEFVPFVFDHYKSNDEGGTGLGLAICKEIIEGCGGIISIESQLEKGTTVFFTLPVMEGNNSY